MLTADALIASTDATHEVLRGPGWWLLALPVDPSPGSRCSSARSERERRRWPWTSRTVFARRTSAYAAEATLDGLGRHTRRSSRPSWDGSCATRGDRALARFDAVPSVAPAPARLAGSAAAAGVRLVRTYGMSETSGGCGRRPPAPGDPGPAGRGRPSAARRSHPGERIPRRPGADRGRLRDGPRRVDVVPHRRPRPVGRRRTPGGPRTRGRGYPHRRYTVDPERVRAAVLDLTGAADALVVGLEDPEWGQVVGLLVAWTDPADALRLPALRDLLRARLAGHEPPG